jgi:quercetin dioxygenase-like cupin family protein
MRKALSGASDMTEYDADGVAFVTLAEHPSFRVTLATFASGGSIGEHPAGVPQLFHVVSGRGWVSGAAGDRVRITAGEHVTWDAGENHASGSHNGMVAVIVQADDPESFSAALR